MIKVLVKRLRRNKTALPQYMTPHAAGMDLFASLEKKVTMAKMLEALKADLASLQDPAKNESAGSLACLVQKVIRKNNSKTIKCKDLL